MATSFSMLNENKSNAEIRYRQKSNNFLLFRHENRFFWTEISNNSLGMKDICVMNASKKLKGLYKQHLCCRSDFTVELFKRKTIAVQKQRWKCWKKCSMNNWKNVYYSCGKTNDAVRFYNKPTSQPVFLINETLSRMPKIQ